LNFSTLLFFPAAEKIEARFLSFSGIYENRDLQKMLKRCLGAGVNPSDFIIGNKRKKRDLEENISGDDFIRNFDSVSFESFSKAVYKQISHCSTQATPGTNDKILEKLG
jgi:hypothetical protein